MRAALVIRRQWPEAAVVLLSFIESVRRVAAGGTAFDPQVVAQLLLRGNGEPLQRLTPRAVAEHINSIFAELDPPAADVDHRRVLAVLRFLAASPT